MASKMNALLEGTTPPSIEVDSINLNFSVGYRDVTDPANPKQANYQDNVNLNFSNEAEMNRILMEKDYLPIIIPILANRVTKGYDPENAVAKKLKTDVKAAIDANSI